MAPTPGLVQRPRLFAMLDRGAAARVTVLSAPAGSGKTTLVSSWLREAEPPGAPAWVAIGREEADAMRFWGTVMDALRASTRACRPSDPSA
jgi:LuxR family maltose regulon positive regulatory protein